MPSRFNETTIENNETAHQLHPDLSEQVCIDRHQTKADRGLVEREAVQCMAKTNEWNERCNGCAAIM